MFKRNICQIGFIMHYKTWFTYKLNVRSFEVFLPSIFEILWE